MGPDEQRAHPAVPVAEVHQKVREVVAKSLELKLDDVTLESSLFDLGAESLDLLDMAFLLEKEYRIQFPRADILERAAQHFREEDLVVSGVVTPLGLEMLRRGMPELDPTKFRPGLKAIDVVKMISVGSFARITVRLLEAKAEAPRDCPKCGAALVESTVMPELECPSCGEIVPLESGDDILLRDLTELFKQSQAES
ncbi:MAG TPA: phosphopantetheine-binding protein [bacterium]|nr:phosphopantetheine-binding protein [bacterium]